MTALAGLPLFLDLAWVTGLVESIRRHLKLREGQQGWTDAQMVMALILLNLAGGEHVSDLEVLEQDPGFSQVLHRVETAGLSRQARRALERRFRRERQRSVPSPSAVFRYLAGFHDPEQERLRVPGKAFIPKPNAALQGLGWVNRDLIAELQQHRPERTATLDMDATLVETGKEEALVCYQGYKAYQPLNTYWAEQGVVLHTGVSRRERGGRPGPVAGPARGSGDAAGRCGNSAFAFGFGRVSASAAGLLRRGARSLRPDRICRQL